jgi:transposase-like protein
MLQNAPRRKPADDIRPVSPATTDFLYDPAATARLIRDVRWDGGIFCPRCRSRGVKKINSFFIHELFQCGECTYTFNCTSGTVFQGSKLPLDRHLLLLMAFDYFRQDLCIKHISGLFSLSRKTTKLQHEKIKPDPWRAGYLYGPDPASLELSGLSIRDLLERYSFSLDMIGFRDRLECWLRT